MIFLFEIIGTVAFAISGAAVGIRTQMDVFGVVILGMTTAVGGGIIRDLILNITPPTAFRQPIYAAVAILVSALIFLPSVRSRVNTNSRLQIVIDAIGLGTFTVAGVKAGMVFDNMFLSVFVGTVTGVGGGVLRDIFAADKPTIFVKQFYACASIIGAICCVIVWDIGQNIAMLTGAAIIIILRLLAAGYRWNLPHA